MALKQIITKIDRDFDYKNNNYGISAINSISNMIYKWKLKIIEMNSNGVDIGIASKQIPNDDITSDGNIYYKFSTNTAFGLKKANEQRFDFWHEYGDKWQQNDTITLCLDLKQQQIKMMINDKDQHIAFINIEKDEYRVAVTIGNIHDKIELISYDTVHE